jgi:LPS sulfotransferase NodH
LYDFLIVCHQRAGSHLLASFLDSHLEICCLGENGSPFCCRDWTIRGRIFMYGSFLRQQKLLLETPKFILLTRNIEKQAFSAVRNSSLRKQHGDRYKAHLKTPDPRQSMTWNFKAPEKMLARIKTRIRADGNQVRELIDGRSTIDVTYEEMTHCNRNVASMPEKLTRRMMEYFGLPYRKLTTDLKKIAPNKIQVVRAVMAK